MRPDEVRVEREEAWIGDAVLALFARGWILKRTGRMDAVLLAAMTSNAFLATIGNPTRLESRIGRKFTQDGLDAAFAMIEEELIPMFLRQRKNRT